MLEARPYDRVRELYLLQEPSLLAAIQRGDRGEARRIINHVLVHIYSVGEERNELLKGLLLELVVMISRAAMETGASQADVLGLNFRSLTELAAIDEDEELAAWLRGILEHVFSIVERRQEPVPLKSISKALRYMRENVRGEISRDEVARYAGVSPSHFSRVLKERTGRSFTELLRECRISRACDMLGNENLSLAEIADDCGFCDQSYFTHVFREIKGMTPKQFRKREREPSSPSPKYGWAGCWNR